MARVHQEAWRVTCDAVAGRGSVTGSEASGLLLGLEGLSPALGVQTGILLATLEKFILLLNRYYS